MCCFTQSPFMMAECKIAAEKWKYEANLEKWHQVPWMRWEWNGTRALVSEQCQGISLPWWEIMNMVPQEINMASCLIDIFGLENNWRWRQINRKIWTAAEWEEESNVIGGVKREEHSWCLTTHWSSVEVMGGGNVFLGFHRKFYRIIYMVMTGDELEIDKIK